MYHNTCLTGNVDDTAADLIRYKNFTEELKERQCHLHDLKQKLDIIEVDDTSGQLKAGPFFFHGFLRSISRAREIENDAFHGHFTGISRANY